MRARAAQLAGLCEHFVDVNNMVFADAFTCGHMGTKPAHDTRARRTQETRTNSNAWRTHRCTRQFGMYLFSISNPLSWVAHIRARVERRTTHPYLAYKTTPPRFRAGYIQRNDENPQGVRGGVDVPSANPGAPVGSAPGTTNFCKKCKKRKKCKIWKIFCPKNLRISKKSSTFAPWKTKAFSYLKYQPGGAP